MDGDATATVDTDGSGDVTAVKFTSVGTSYTDGQLVTFTEDGGSGEGQFFVTATTNETLGGIASYTIQNWVPFATNLSAVDATMDPDYGTAIAHVTTDGSGQVTFVGFNGGTDFYYVGQEVEIHENGGSGYAVITVTNLI